MLSSSAAQSGGPWQQAEGREEGRGHTSQGESGMQQGGGDVTLSSSGLCGDDEGEEMVQRFRGALTTTADRTETAGALTADVQLGRTAGVDPVSGHHVSEKDGGEGCGANCRGVVREVDGASETYPVETNRPAGSRQDDSSSSSSRPQRDRGTHGGARADPDLSAQSGKGRAWPAPLGVATGSAADLDGGEAAPCSTASSAAPSATTTTASSSSSSSALSGAVPMDGPSAPDSVPHVPDLIPARQTDQAAPTRTEACSWARSESRGFAQRCACAENDNCPKRSALIFTELVADVGGCLCSKSDVRDRLPKGWPDVFDPLPDLIASQHSFESQA